MRALPHVAGFTLNADGSAKSINMATLLYKKWELSGGSIRFIVESIGNGISFTDTLNFTIVSVGKHKLTLKNREQRMEYRRR